jgi:hypothetical protein
VSAKPLDKKILEFTVAPSNTNYIYVLLEDSDDILLTKDGGTTWSIISGSSKGLPNRQPTFVMVHPTEPERVWVSYSGFASLGKVFYSSSAGATWSNYSEGLPNSPANHLIMDESNLGTLAMYVGTDVGVYYRNSSLTSWQCYRSAAFPNVRVMDLDIHYPTRQLVVGTFGRGVWVTPLACPDYPTNLVLNDATLPAVKESPMLRVNNVIKCSYLSETSPTSPATMTLNTPADGHKIEYVAGEKIVFGPGFTSGPGLDFVARIEEPIACKAYHSLPRVAASTVADVIHASTLTSSTSHNGSILIDPKIYPSPFTESFSLSFTIAADAQVTVELTNALGQTIRTCCGNVSYAAGVHSMPVDGRGLAPGTYFAKIMIDGAVVKTVPVMKVVE